jgi:sec-independent protein translocase protein TatB
MEILGIGPLELLFILLIALILLGPNDMVKAGRALGRLMRKTILSPTFLDMQRTIRNLPNELMRQAGLEESDLKVKIDPITIPTNFPISTSQRAATNPSSASPQLTPPNPAPSENNSSESSINPSNETNLVPDPGQDHSTGEDTKAGGVPGTAPGWVQPSPSEPTASASSNQEKKPDHLEGRDDNSKSK